MNPRLMLAVNRALPDSAAIRPPELPVAPRAQSRTEEATRLYQCGNRRQAELICRQILRKRPNDVEALNALGVMKSEWTFDKESKVEALTLFKRAVKAHPDDARSHANLGNAYAALGRYPDALASHDKALKLVPDFGGAYFHRGHALRVLGRFQEALESYQRALSAQREKPDRVHVLAAVGALLCDLRRHDEGLAYIEEAIRLRPDDATANLARSQELLKLGRYREAWHGYEARHAYYRLFRHSMGDPARFSSPPWSGKESMSGKTVLLHAEAGLGDTLQFCRYVSLVSELGATVILETQPRLLELLKGLHGVSQLIPRGAMLKPPRNDALPPHDYNCPLMSLPLVFGTTLETIPAAPYLRADPAKMEYWRERLGPRKKPRVGLVWRAGQWGITQTQRYIPLAMLEPLKRCGAEFYCLQKGEEAEAELAALTSGGWDGPQLIDHTAECNRDFSDTAAFIENLDLVVTIDTSVAHCAGALGKPTWIMTLYDAEWRWLVDRSDSPWYPSVTLYRQERPGDWKSVVQRIADDLTKLVAA